MYGGFGIIGQYPTLHYCYFFAALGVVNIVVSLTLDLVMENHTLPNQKIRSFLSEGGRSPPKTVARDGGWEIGGRGVHHTGAYSTNSRPLIVTIGAWESGGRREVIGHPYGTSGGRTGLRTTSWTMSLTISSEE